MGTRILFLALLNNEMKKQGFIFEIMQQWLIINLVNFIHGYSCLISLEIVLGYNKLRSFQGTQVNLSVLLEKGDVTYPLRDS